MQSLRASPFWRIAAVVIVLFLVLAGVRLIQAREDPTGSGSTTPGAPAVPVDVLTVREEAARDTNILSAQIEPFRVATVSAEAADRVIERPVQAGDHVKAGQLLAVLDSSTAQNALQGAVAASAGNRASVQAADQEYLRAQIETASGLQGAKAQLAAALANERKVRSFTRPEELKTAEAALFEASAAERLARIHAAHESYLEAHGVVPQEQLDSARAALDTATGRREAAQQAVALARQGARQADIDAAAAQVDAARAAVRAGNARQERLAALRDQVQALRAKGSQADAAARQAQIALRRHRLMAPFAGRVLVTLVNVGEMTAPGQPVVRIGDISQVKILFAATEASRPALRMGQPVSFTVDAIPGRQFWGQITTLGVQADPRSRTFPVELTVTNPNETLLPNMVARVKLPVGQPRHRILIPAGAVATDGGSSYVYVISQGHALRREVTVMPAAGETVEVEHGLSPGEQIASAPQWLTDGAEVSVVE